MRVMVYHNVARDGAGCHLGFDGYQLDHPLVPDSLRTPACSTAARLNSRIAEAALEAFNPGPGRRPAGAGHRYPC